MKRLCAAIRHLVHSFVARDGRRAQLVVRSVAHVEETDVIVFAVVPAQSGFVVQREPVHADAIRVGGGVFEVVSIGLGALLLILQPSDSGGGKAGVERAEMLFAHQHRHAQQRMNLLRHPAAGSRGSSSG